MFTTLTDDNFEAEVIKSSRPYLVEFRADWCAPCTMMAATLEAVAEKYGDTFNYGRVNADDNPGTIDTHEVRGLPTVLLFKEGKIAEKFIGLVPRDNMERILNYHS